MIWDEEPRCIAVLEAVERQTAHMTFDSEVSALEYLAHNAILFYEAENQADFCAGILFFCFSFRVQSWDVMNSLHISMDTRRHKNLII